MEIREGILPTEEGLRREKDGVGKEKEAMEEELSEHKRRIRKLEEDIGEVMRLFEQAEEKSELHRSKLVVSE